LSQTLLAFLVLPVLLVLLGSRFPGLLANPGDGALYRCVVYGLAGAVVFHLLLTLLDLAGIPWHPILLLAGLGILIAAGHVRGRKDGRDGARLPSDPGWGDGVALFVLAVFTLLALTQWIMTPDFVFHWGLKGERFFLARGIDEAWLARNDMIHSDYPNLLPELHAASALLGGRFDPPVLMLWSALFLAGLLAAAREALRAVEDRFIRQAGLALVALAAGMFGIGWQMAGAADWMLALALLAALPPLLRPPDPAGDWQIGIAAAFAAASKLEGVPLAGFLILVQLVRNRFRIGTLARLALPAVAVVIPWLAQVIRYNLFQNDNAGPFEMARAGALFSTAYEILAGPSWHGVAWVVLLAPLLLLPRRTRPFAAVVTLQLLLYVYIYFTAPVDVRYYVLTSLPRLLLHVIPGVLVLALLARKLVHGPREVER
jgi:hypothetical protein